MKHKLKHHPRNHYHNNYHKHYKKHYHKAPEVKITKHTVNHKIPVIVFGILFGITGLVLQFGTFAATNYGIIEAELANRTGSISVISDSQASGGNAIEFTAPAEPAPVIPPAQPNPTPPPTPPAPEPRYDLVVTDTGVTGEYYLGIKQQLWADVKNTGNALVSGGIGVGMFVDGVQQTWGYVNEPINPGQTIRVYGTGVMNGDPSSFWYPTTISSTIRSYVDDTNQKPFESNESNNTFDKTISFNALNVSPYNGVPTNQDLVWCGPPWDAPQEEFNLAAQRGIGYLGPPCKANGGFVEQTVEQNNIAMDKAANAGTKILIFGGYVCNDAYNHYCYKMFMNPDEVMSLYPSRSGMAGYFVVDEPPFEEFDQIASVNQRVYARRPGMLSYTNIFGNILISAPRQYLGCAPNKCPIDYADYVWNYILKTRPQILSYDDYEPSNVVNFRSTSVVETQLRVMRDYYGIPIVPVMTAVPSVTNGFVAKDSVALWNRYQDLKAHARAHGTILHFTWRRPPGAEWYGDGECGVARAQLGYSGPPICGY